jgi:hypothetical protein
MPNLDVENLNMYRHLSSEFLIHYLRYAFSASKEQIRALLIAAMYAPIRSPEIFDGLVEAILANDINAAFRALTIQKGGRNASTLHARLPSTDLNSLRSITAPGKSLGTVQPAPLVERIIDLYMSVEDSTVSLNLLRYMIFFDNPAGLASFMTRIEGATPTEISTLVPNHIWNAESI